MKENVFSAKFSVEVLSLDEFNQIKYFVSCDENFKILILFFQTYFIEKIKQRLKSEKTSHSANVDKNN